VNHAATMVRAIVTATGAFVNLWYVSHSGEDDLQICSRTCRSDGTVLRCMYRLDVKCLSGQLRAHFISQDTEAQFSAIFCLMGKGERRAGKWNIMGMTILTSAEYKCSGSLAS
jgi:hypothetical protein